MSKNIGMMLSVDMNILSNYSFFSIPLHTMYAGFDKNLDWKLICTKCFILKAHKSLIDIHDGLEIIQQNPGVFIKNKYHHGMNNKYFEKIDK